MQLYHNYLKRFLDLIVSLVAFSLLLPLFIIVTVLLYIANQGKPFFVQPRPGRNGRIFRLVKFKTMNDRKDAAGNLLSDAERLTAVGKFIRKTSLDEIPQLINVIKGEMSLIGPRPLLVEYLPLYNDNQKRRHEVRPGITGWAQVNGRNAIGWKEKFELDVWYVDNMSLLLDCKIIIFTMMKVVKSEGVSQQGHVTMTKFQGN
jgi:lipopolysaccharide/colanic/teichoic acid biosynthesis glycosyltransferase